MNKFYYATIFLMLFAFGSFSQGRMVINNNAFVIISNSAKVVLENSATNAITVAGTGANIVSEGQNNQIIWKIGNTTGNYMIPWTTKPVVQGGNGTKIPMNMNITSAGNAAGRFVFSTYETATDNNTAYPTYPTAITQMNSAALGGADGALYVVDRFWILDNTSYATIPDATLSFAYDDAANEIAGSNTITEANLRAQRWNISTTDWEALLFGNTNAATNVTSNVNAVAADFWPVWILVDLTVPLPVELINQNIANNDCINTITWSLESESNVSHYNINRSYDGINWTQISTVDAVKNSFSQNTYYVRDSTFESNGIIYYQISQVDLNGKVNKFEPMGKSSFCRENEEPVLYPNPIQNTLIVKTVNPAKLKVFDSTGKLVLYYELNEIQNNIDVSFLATGVYSAVISTEKNDYFQKLVKQLK